MMSWSATPSCGRSAGNFFWSGRGHRGRVGKDGPYQQTPLDGRARESRVGVAGRELQAASTQIARSGCKYGKVSQDQAGMHPSS
jgi:hypothetical protein